MPNNETYKNRDMLLGRIDERTQQIPLIKDDVEELRKETKELHGRMVKVEVKSTMWGVFGGAGIIALAKLKTLFWIG